MPRGKIPNFQKVALFEEWNLKEKIGFKWIAGKYFVGDDEVNASRWLIDTAAKNPRNFFGWSDTADLESWLKCYVMAYGEPTGRWPLTAAARKGSDPNYTPHDFELAFPLTDKQLQILNIILYHPEEEVLFILSGVGGSGKSTFANIVKQLMANDVFAASLSDLSNEFITSEAIKHRLIYSDELASDTLKSNVIKQLASKDEITANPKNQTPYTTRTQSALIFSCNKPPKIDITDTGIMRRIIYYYRPDRIVSPDMSLRTKTYTDKELADIAFAAKHFEDPDWRDKFKAETRKLLVENNSVYLAMKQWCKTRIPKITGKPKRTDYTYQIYSSTAQAMGMKAFNQPNFDEIVSLFIEWGYILDE